MNDQRDTRVHKRSVFRQPEMLVAIAAIVLSICGLFIALYEASIARRAERASVWPHIEVSTSVRGSRVEIRVQNTGVGPARINAANLTYNGNVMTDWTALLQALDIELASVSRSYSLIGGRVLGADAGAETMLVVDIADASADPVASQRLAAAILDSSVDVTLCYCSVYDECWIARLQELLERRRGGRLPEAEQRVPECSALPQSAI